MPFKQFDRFKLSKPISQDDSIPIGCVGVILDIWNGSPRGYEVEFPDGSGGNIGRYPTFTLTEDFLESVDS